MLSERQKRILEQGAEIGNLPTNVACKVGCRFCYERYVKKDYDRLEFRAIPRYSEEAFEYFMDAVRRMGNDRVRPDSMTSVSPEAFHMGPNADFFTLGLSIEQIDRIISAASPEDPIYLYATGLDVEPDTIRYLTAKHGPKFVLRLSAITFDEEIRSKVVQNSVSAERLKGLIAAANVPRVMIMGYSYEQLTDDLRVLNELAPGGVRALISILNYTDSYPQDLHEMAAVGFRDFPASIEYLSTHRSRFGNFQALEFLFPPEAYAWTFRKFLRDALHDFGDGDLALCSGGAENVVRYLNGDLGLTRGIPNPAGGSIDFSTTLTTQSVIDALSEVEGSGYPVRRIFAPSSIWWVKGEYDLQARRSSEVQEAFPHVDFVEVQVPQSAIDHCLTLDECVEFYSNRPLQDYLAMRRDQEGSEDASASRRPYVSPDWACDAVPN